MGDKNYPWESEAEELAQKGMAGDDECWQCGGEGYVYQCFDGYCEYAEEGCEDCARRCDICNRRTGE